MTIRTRIHYSVSPVLPPLWRFKDDFELWGHARQKVLEQGKGYPGVIPIYPLDDKPMVELTCQWQFYCRAINYGMDIKNVSALFGHYKAYCNGTGLGDPNDPRADYLLGESLKDKPPQFDKVRSNIRCTISGRPQNGRLLLTLFDGNQPPPLKPGKKYPQIVGAINIDDYLYNPKDHRWLFLVCNNIDPKCNVYPFDHGAKYDWTGDNMPCTFLPHVARKPLSHPLESFIKITDGKIPNPYIRRSAT